MTQAKTGSLATLDDCTLRRRAVGLVFCAPLQASGTVLVPSSSGKVLGVPIRIVL